MAETWLPITGFAAGVDLAAFLDDQLDATLAFREAWEEAGRREGLIRALIARNERAGKAKRHARQAMRLMGW